MWHEASRLWFIQKAAFVTCLSRGALASFLSPRVSATLLFSPKVNSWSGLAAPAAKPGGAGTYCSLKQSLLNFTVYTSFDSPCLWESPTASSNVEPQTPSLTAEENFSRDSAAKSAATQICSEACRSANLYICKGEIYWPILVCNLPDTFSVF